MSDFAIRVESLGKLYRIGSAKERNKTFREAMIDMTAAPWRYMKRTFLKQPITNDEKSDYIWALKDVSFEVKRGEVVGIIGSNGAGKSTLLKILSRITEPTEGRVVLRGRVGSLLEVGTGFHSELTGEENIYLSGTILGMSSNEISRKFSEIVAFAEMGKFIHTPVKYYSSGMYMRLAFAVAAYLEPEILLVDEVLAVGDQQFQNKCIGKMSEVAEGGRTVLFVSHNMGAIASLCSRAVLIESGRLMADGETKLVINQYLLSQQTNHQGVVSLEKRPRSDSLGKELIFQSIWLEKIDGGCANTFNLYEPFYINFQYRVIMDLPSALVAFRLETMTGQIIVDSWDADSLEASPSSVGLYTVRVKVSPQDLHPGMYQITLWAAVHLIRWLDRIPGASGFEILPASENIVWRSERTAILARIYPWHRIYVNSLDPCHSDDSESACMDSHDDL